jgi:CRISPR-associated protein Cmr6
MPVAAVPNYLRREPVGRTLDGTSPGLRFGMYLRLWGVDHGSNQWLWTSYDVKYERRGKDQRERPVQYENKRAALDVACRLTPGDGESMRAFVDRQASIASRISSELIMRLDAVAVAPFTTGLGNEHPLENGFAFLNPYGLPYLPGSGVKGVIRQAARELASGDWGDTGGWSTEPIYSFKIGQDQIDLSVLDVLFGREIAVGESNHLRGVLSFWDVLPVVEGDRLAVEVMTPHQSDYYQGRSSPHDSGSPNPINFLTVPPKSKFLFHVLCDHGHLRRLAPPLAQNGNWKKLTEAAFAHAFEWLGFGAKTSIGYGAFAPAGGERASSVAQAHSTTKQSPTAASVNEMIWRDAILSWNAGGGGRLTISFEKRRAEAVCETAQRLLQPLPPELAQQIKRRGLKADVRVQIDGNMARAIEIILPPAKEN